MKSTKIKVLLVEDDEDDVILAKEYLSKIDNFDFEVVWESRLEEARKKVLESGYGIFLVDYHLGGENGLELIKFVREQGILTPSIILTGQSNLTVDIDASRYGAADYLVKNELNPSILERSIRYALSQSKIIRELDEKEKRYRSLFERSIDPILLATRGMALTDVNESFLKLFGYTDDETKGVALSIFFADNDGYDLFTESLSETEFIKDLEVTMKTKTGERKDCLLNCVYIPHPTQELCCYQCIVHDLTLRKQAENDLLIAERLSLTGKMARTIAHEVRNPLTNLNLALDQLRREIPEESESGKLYGDIIERNSNRIEQLVGEMLRSSKPKELYLQLASVPEILDDTLKLAVDRLKLNQMELKLTCPNDLPKILVDKHQIQIALLNIIINAIEAMAPGKGILKVAASLKKRMLTVTIADNGKGIETSNLGKLFDPFFTGKQNGMGLGLTSTKNILNSHCAHVDVSSEVGRGTTF
ncbi:MAG TPA: ATP-binding protein, partial [Chryseolinea sp.]|nr:ATP-binding protein [Chryseolinea sp.]